MFKQHKNNIWSRLSTKVFWSNLKQRMLVGTLLYIKVLVTILGLEIALIVTWNMGPAYVFNFKKMTPISGGAMILFILVSRWIFLILSEISTQEKEE